MKFVLTLNTNQVGYLDEDGTSQLTMTKGHFFKEIIGIISLIQKHKIKFLLRGIMMLTLKV